MECRLLLEQFGPQMYVTNTKLFSGYDIHLLEKQSMEMIRWNRVKCGPFMAKHLSSMPQIE